MIAPARAAAIQALEAIAAGRSDLPVTLARARRDLADPRDQALTAELVNGTLRWQAALDFALQACTDRPLDRVDAAVLTVLRVSAYQLLHLERVPPSAVVHDAVEIARASGHASAAGFVNAVLRRLGRESGSLRWPARPAADATGGGAKSDRAHREASLDYLSVTLSHPRWLVARWLDRVGFEAVEQWARFDNAPAPLTLRANTLRISRDALAERLRAEGVDTEPTRFAPDGLVVLEGHPLRGALAAERLFAVQDEASQLVAHVSGARAGERILDACASPGGKTTAMAAMLGDQGLIVASDLRRRRVALLRDTVRASGAASIRVVRADVERALPFGAVFDCVLVDAPCSGLGTIRRDPDIRWRRREDTLPVYAAAQRRMLHRAAAAVAPGGRLVYATCSSEPEENDAVVDGFLDEQSAFTAEDPRAAGHPFATVLAPVLDERGQLRTTPPAHGLEAFFAAVIRRRA